MNSWIAKTLSQNQTLYGMWHTTEFMAIFVSFLPILAKIYLPWQRPILHYYQIRLTAFFQDNLGKPAPER